MSFKVPVCRRPEYTIYLQQIEQNTWAHCDVNKWSAGIAKKLIADADQLFEMHGGPWFAFQDPPGCEKHHKFLELVGFKRLKEIEGLDGETRAIYVRQYGI